MKSVILFFVFFIPGLAQCLKAQDITKVASLHPTDDLNVILNFQNPSCHGVCDGSVSAEPEGGQPPYTYLWSNGMTSPGIHDLCAGSGEVTVMDADSNSSTVPFTLVEPEPLGVVFGLTNPSCADSCDGDIKILDLMGGDSNYTYMWGGMGTIHGLCAGEYGFTLTDGNGCSLDTSLFLINPAPLHFTGNFLLTQPTGGLNNGSILVQGNWPGFKFSLNGIHYTLNKLFSHLGPGIYIIYFKDPDGCPGTSDEIILEDITAVNELATFFRKYPNPVSDEFHIDSDIPLAVELFDLQGRRMVKEDFKTNHEISMTDFPDGMYVLKICDGEKCAFRKVVRSTNTE